MLGGLWMDITLRGIGLRIESFTHDLFFAMRVLYKAPLFTIAVVVTLSIAISVNVVAFGAINAVLFKQLPFANVKHLAFICNPLDAMVKKPECSESVFQTAHVKAFLGMHDPVEKSAMFQIMPGTITGLGIPQSRITAWSSTALFDVLQVQPEIGRFFIETDGEPGVHNVVISDRLWRSLYDANRDVLGKPIVLDGITYHIIGVAPSDFVLPDPADAELRSQTVDIFEAAPNEAMQWGPHSWSQAGLQLIEAVIIARIQPGFSSVAVQAQLDRVNAPFLLDEARQYGIRSTSLIPNPMFVSVEDWYSNVNDAHSLLTIVFLATLAVLLIACANVANLLLVRGTARQGELAIRSALGATRARIIQQLIIEMCVLAVISGILGVVLAYIELQLLTVLNSMLLPRMQDISIDGRVLLFICITVILAVALGGIIPAFFTTQENLADTLKSAGRGRDAAAGKIFRSLLVVLEIAVAFVVLVSAALLVRSFILIVQKPLGFNPHNTYIAAINLPQQYGTLNSYVTFANAAIAHIQAIPGVETVAISRGGTYLLKNYLRYSPDNTIGVTLPGMHQMSMPSIKVTPHYFASLRIPILRGRDFNAEDRLGSLPVVIISQDCATKLFLHTDPLGKHVQMSVIGSPNEQATIVGIVGNMVVASILPNWTYVPYAQHPASRFELSIRTYMENPQLRDEVASAIASFAPTVGIERFDSLEEEVMEAQTPQRTSAGLLGALALVALLLALGGVYAVVSYAVQRRTHEFGIRKAVGAQTSDILKIVLRSVAIYAIAGIAFGIVFSTFSTQALTNLLVQTSPFDLLSFLCVIVLLFVSIVAAAALPTINAMRIDPVVALRYE